MALDSLIESLLYFVETLQCHCVSSPCSVAAQLREQAELHLVSGQRSRWLRRLANKYDNLRAALAWAQNDAASAVRCGYSNTVSARTSPGVLRSWPRGFHVVCCGSLTTLLLHFQVAYMYVQTSTPRCSGDADFCLCAVRQVRCISKESLMLQRL